MNLLEEAAAELKAKYPADYHTLINRNLAWVSSEMDPPGSVAIQEGIIALRRGLPALPLKPRKPYRSGKSSGKR
ncbi:hypothetical protein [Granulicella tundricola]|uniref:hypothetical protein n=1 Tax=Granulicella tundricola TaxID=940615 RepID=UPI0012F8A43D|nr:hypothetical protein [Granulicella tundricola]